MASRRPNRVEFLLVSQVESRLQVLAASRLDILQRFRRHVRPTNRAVVRPVSPALDLQLVRQVNLVQIHLGNHLGSRQVFLLVLPLAALAENQRPSHQANLLLFQQ